MKKALLLGAALAILATTAHAQDGVTVQNAPSPLATTTYPGLVEPDGTSIVVDVNGQISATTGGGGTVTSVALADISSTPIFDITDSPVITLGTLNEALKTQTKNTGLFGPTTGADAQPAFRALVGADLPNPSSSTLGGVQSKAAVTHQFLTAISTSGVPASAQPACADISDAGTGCTVNTGTSGATIPLLNAANTWSALQTYQGATTTSPGLYVQVTGDTVPRIRFGLNTTDVASVGLGDGTNARDTFIERAAAANVRQGAPDAATAVSQTSSVQNIVAGTSNVAGANRIIAGSQGTGTGAGGSITLQTAPAGSTGTAVNALANSAILTSAGDFTILGSYTQKATGIFTWTGRMLLTSSAAGTLVLGSTAAASPVAATVKGQDSRSGTDSNVGGANVTVTAGNGTGTGTISSLILQSPVAVASGTGAQTQTTGLTIKGGQAVMTGYTVSTLPTGITGGRAYVTDAVTCTFLGALTGSGSTVCPVFYNGSAWLGG